MLAVAGVLLGTVLQAIDGSIVNVALPQIQRSMNAGLPVVSWAVTGYVLASLVAMPLSASLARRLGTRRYFAGSVVLFTATSLACGLAPSASWLVFFRVLQGFGAGGLLPISQGILMTLYTGERRARAIALVGFAAVLGPLVGPPIGGVLTDGFGWRSIFLINVPLGVISLVLLKWLVVPAEENRAEELDVRGTVYLALTVTGLQAACARLPALFIPAAIFGALFWREEKRAQAPAVDLGVLRHRALSGTLVAAPLYGIGLYGSVFVTPLLLEHQLSFNAANAGLVVAIGGVASGVGILSAKPLLRRFRPRALCVAGAVLFFCSMLWLAWVSHQNGGEVMLAQGLRGAGTGLLYVGMNGFAFDQVPQRELATASSFFYLLRQLGGSLGVALCALVMDRLGVRGTVMAFVVLAVTAPVSLVPLLMAEPHPSPLTDVDVRSAADAAIEEPP